MKKLFVIIFLSCAIASNAQDIIMPPAIDIDEYNERSKVPMDFRKNGNMMLVHSSLYQSNMEKLDTVLLRVQYDVRYRETEKGDLLKDVEALNIGKTMSEYHENITQYAEEHIPDSLKKTVRSEAEIYLRGSASQMIQEQYRNTNYTIQKNYPENGIMRCYYYLEFEHFHTNQSMVNPNIYYEEPIPQFSWELAEEDTIICGYACQGATTSFRGRTWKVWYAPELPYQDGPWKLCGLPGLIMKAEDREGDFCFEAVEILKAAGEYIVVHPTYEQYAKVTFKRALELTNMRYKNPQSLLRLMVSEQTIKMLESRGQKIVIPRPVVPCLLEKYE